MCEKFRFRLEDVYLSIETSTVPGGQVDPLFPLRGKDTIGDKEKGKKVAKGE